jgi:hypothetical protein
MNVRKTLPGSLRRWAIALGVGLTVLGSGTAAQAANLVTNGSFEQGDSGWTLVAGGGGWLETAPAYVYGVTGQDGDIVCELDSNSNSRIGQSLPTTPGAVYHLNFLTAKRAGTDNASNQIRAYVDGVLVATVNPTSTVMVNNGLNFTATGATTALEFEGGGTSDSYGSMIDGVDIEFAPVTIDIKPGSFPNTINLGSNGYVRVAILSTPDLNASPATIDLSSLRFASAKAKLKGNGTFLSTLEDVNHDGILDLVIQFSTDALVITDGDVPVTLTGTLLDGTPLAGSDTIRVVPAS